MVHAVDLLEVSSIAMEQQLYYYYLDWMGNGTWNGTILTKMKNLTTPQDLRNNRNKFPHIPKSGWHFSYMGGADRIIDKMTSIVDGNELVVKSGYKIIDKDHVKKTMANGTDLYGRKNIPASQCILSDIRNIDLPYILEFVKKYPYFLKPKD